MECWRGHDFLVLLLQNRKAYLKAEIIEKAIDIFKDFSTSMLCNSWADSTSGRFHLHQSNDYILETCDSQAFSCPVITRFTLVPVLKVNSYFCCYFLSSFHRSGQFFKCRQQQYKENAHASLKMQRICPKVLELWEYCCSQFTDICQFNLIHKCSYTKQTRFIHKYPWHVQKSTPGDVMLDRHLVPRSD